MVSIRANVLIILDGHSKHYGKKRLSRVYVRLKILERALVCPYVHLTIVLAGLPSSVSERNSPIDAVLLIFKDTDAARVVSYLDGGSACIALREAVNI